MSYSIICCYYSTSFYTQKLRVKFVTLLLKIFTLSICSVQIQFTFFPMLDDLPLYSLGP